MTHRLNTQDPYNIELQARHPDAIMALLAMATTSKSQRPFDFVVMDGMCLDLLRFTEAKRFLIYNNLDRGKVGAMLSLLHQL